jgi:hypothetical protein
MFIWQQYPEYFRNRLRTLLKLRSATLGIPKDASPNYNSRERLALSKGSTPRYEPDSGTGQSAKKSPPCDVLCFNSMEANRQ